MLRRDPWSLPCSHKASIGAQEDYPLRGCRSILLAFFLLALGLAPAWAIEPASVARAAINPIELRLMALNIYHEAKGEGRKGMLAVGWVVLNRMRDAGFPKGVEGVVQQGCQFGWVCDDRSDEPNEQRAWRAALKIAQDLLTDPPPDPTRGAMWFHQASMADPGWNGRIAPAVQIGNHLFYAKTSRLPRFVAKPRVRLQVAER